MNCFHVTSLLSDSLDAPLPSHDRAVVDEHLGSCPACLEDFRSLLATREVLRHLKAVEDAEAASAPPLPARLVARITAAREAEGKGQGQGQRVG